MAIGSQPLRILGRKTPKVDAIDKVTARARLGTDIPLPRLLMGKVLRSPLTCERLYRAMNDTGSADARGQGAATDGCRPV